MDIDQADLEQYESIKREMENIDDLQTECDIDDDIAEWIEEPVKGTEFETMTCEEVFEYDEVRVENIAVVDLKEVVHVAQPTEVEQAGTIVEAISAQPEVTLAQQAVQTIGEGHKVNKINTNQSNH